MHYRMINFGAPLILGLVALSACVEVNDPIRSQSGHETASPNHDPSPEPVTAVSVATIPPPATEANNTSPTEDPALALIPEDEWETCCKSPDGKWHVEIAEIEAIEQATGTELPLGGRGFHGARVVSEDGNGTLVAVARSHLWDIATRSVGVSDWSPSGETVIAYVKGLGGGCALFPSYERIAIVNTKTMTTTQLDDRISALSFNMDREILIYIENRVLYMTRFDGVTLASIELLSVVPQGAQIGGWLWSPSGNRVAATIANNACITESVFVLDLDEARVEIVMKEGSGERRPARWAGEDRLIVTVGGDDEAENGDESSEVEVDVWGP